MEVVVFLPGDNSVLVFVILVKMLDEVRVLLGVENFCQFVCCFDEEFFGATEEG